MKFKSKKLKIILFLIILANVLSLEFPEKKEKLINLGKNIALSRVYAGLHFPSDNEFGEQIAKILFIFYNENN